MKKRFRIPEGPSGKYDYLLISKFFVINRGARFIFERFARMRIGEELFKAEKDFLTEILYNRETALAWDFTHCGRVRSEVALL
jgi:hypothetical protein